MSTNYLNSYEVYPDADDECIAREDDHYDGPYGHGRCTCGRDRAMQGMNADPHADAADYRAIYESFPGCGGCDPVMHDCRPYKWGIELFEDESRLAAVRGTWGCFLPGLLREQDRLAIIDKATTASRRRQRAGELLWDRICRTAETYDEAVARYSRWAERTKKCAYRDMKTK